ncbi:MAG: SpoIID/LytB domain-containing protein [Myxococcota bacterium]
MRVRSVLASLACIALLPQGASAEPSVRVRVREGVHSVRLSGSALRVEGRPVKVRELLATAERGRIRVADLATRSPVRIAGARGVSVDGHHYPGRLALLPHASAGMDVVNIVPLEVYVVRSLAREIYESWPEAVLKAQAVVTRSYALHQRARPGARAFDLEASVVSQRYGGGPVSARLRQAGRETRGEYLSWRHEPILAVFHASAGGRTASAREVWGEELPYLRSVESPDAEAPDHFWSFELARGDLLRSLREVGLRPGSGEPVRVLERSATRRVRELRVGKAVVSGRELRQILGGRAIRSALFEVRTEGDRVRFLGSGAGHGVGLSQWGARELARRGLDYREILAHYYPGTRLERLDPARELSALP